MTTLWVNIISLFYRQENWDVKSLSNFAKVPQLFKYRNQDLNMCHLRAGASSRYHAASNNILDQQVSMFHLVPWDKKRLWTLRVLSRQDPTHSKSGGGQRTLNVVKDISSATQLIWLLFIARDRHLILAENAKWEQAGCRHVHCLVLLSLQSLNAPKQL